MLAVHGSNKNRSMISDHFLWLQSKNYLELKCKSPSPRKAFLEIVFVVHEVDLSLLNNEIPHRHLHVPEHFENFLFKMNKL